VLRDQQGNSVSGASADAIDLYDRAISDFNIYRGDPVCLLDQAIKAAPDFAMANIAKAQMFVTTSEPAAIAAARDIVTEASKLKLNDREQSHIAALRRLFEDGWAEAARALERHNIRYPRDLLALQSGHLLDFLCANARKLHDRIARALPEWTGDIPGYSILLGMQAFGLEESGNYSHAEDRGREAVSLQPLDCWAHHAVAHVMEMQGRPEDGLGWMIAREPYWSGEDNGFKVHNWWHRALFHLQLRQTDEALALYDGPVREERSPLALDLVDASALLWRLQLNGIDVATRWKELADSWVPHADGKAYPFNDWHGVMAFLGAGYDGDVARVIRTMQQTATLNSETGRWVRDIGLPLVEGFVSFWRADYAIAVDRLFHARHIVNAFGGSHAQRDVIDWTLTEAAIRAGYRELVKALINERIAQKPHCLIASGFAKRIGSGASSSAVAA
jgi:hypothetical protein